MTAPQERRVRVASDVGLHVRLWEAGGERRWLCVHGLSSNGRTWDGVATRLHERGHPVATVDLRGHGRSDKPDDGYDFPTLCADLAAVLDDLGWATAAVAGQSMGGNLAVELAARRPERVTAVAGVDGGAIDLQQRWPEWNECEAALAPPRLAGTPRADLEAWLRRHHPDWSDEGIDATLANVEVLGDGRVRPHLTFERHIRLLRALWEHRPGTVLPRLTAPVLLVVAVEADRDGTETAPKAAAVEAVVAAARAGTVSVRQVSPADHDVHVQQPELVAELFDGFRN